MANKNHEPTPQYRAMQELRRSNAAQPHDPRPGREKTRADAKRKAIKDQS